MILKYITKNTITRMTKKSANIAKGNIIFVLPYQIIFTTGDGKNKLM